MNWGRKFVGSLAKRALRAALVLAAGLGIAGTAAAAQTKIDKSQEIYAFEVGWGEMAIGEGAFTVVDQPNGSYQIITGGRSVGPLARWAPWKGSLVSVGRVQAGEREPIEYKATSLTKSGAIRAQVLWLEEGAPITAVSPRADPEKVTPIDPEAIQDVSDSLTFYASLFDEVRRSDGRSCSRAATVWDGYRLYSLSASAIGPGTAPKDRPWAYEGPTIRCELIFTRIGGFPKRSGWGAPEGDTPRTIHFAEIAGKWAPVRVEIPTPIGRVIVRTKFTENQLVWTDD